MKKHTLFFCIGLLTQQLNAQVTGEVSGLDRDAAYIQYTPNVRTDDFTYNRISGKLDAPSIRLKKFSLFTTIGLDVHQFKYTSESQIGNTKALNNFYNINLSLFASYTFSNKWSLNVIAAPFILSNLEGILTREDFNVNGNCYLERVFYRKKGGYVKLDVGAGYQTLNGKTALIPTLEVKARFNKHWSLSLGIPSTYFKWDINEKHSLKVLGDRNDFYTNLNGTSNLGAINTVNRAVFTSISAGLEYNYWITSSVGIMLKATQNVWTNYELRNTSEESIYEFNTSFERAFIGVGIKYNPIRKLQNGLNPL